MSSVWPPPATDHSCTVVPAEHPLYMVTLVSLPAIPLSRSSNTPDVTGAAVHLSLVAQSATVVLADGYRRPSIPPP